MATRVMGGLQKRINLLIAPNPSQGEGLPDIRLQNDGIGTSSG